MDEEAKSKRAKETYANHIIIERSPNRIIIQKAKGDSTYWLCLCAAHGQLSVFGDTDPFVFAYYSDPVKDGDYVKAMANWMSGKYHQTLDGYVIQKATIGGDKESLYTFSDEEFDKDVRSTIRRVNEYYDKDKLTYEQFKEEIGFDYSCDNVHGNAINSHVFYDWLGEQDIQDAYEHMPDNFGQEICMGLYFAHAAISRVNDLLSE